MSDADNSPQGDRPRFLFVGGPGRSGTTLMGRTVGAHPEVSYLEETFLLFRYRQVHDVSRLLFTDAYPDSQADKEALLRPGQVRRQRGATKARIGDINRATHQSTRQWLRLIIERLRIPLEQVIVDKSPRDVEHYAWGIDNLPRSRYLVMIQDPRVVVASRMEQEHRRQNTGYVPGARPSAAFLERARYWSKQWVDYLAIAEKARQIDRDRVLFVDYRDMVLEPERTAVEAQRFIGLDPDPRVAEYLGGGGYRGELTTTQLDSWKQRLHKNMVKEVENTVGPHIDHFR